MHMNQRTIEPRTKILSGNLPERLARKISDLFAPAGRDLALISVASGRLGASLRASVGAPGPPQTVNGRSWGVLGRLKGHPVDASRTLSGCLG